MDRKFSRSRSLINAGEGTDYANQQRGFSVVLENPELAERLSRENVTQRAPHDQEIPYSRVPESGRVPPSSRPSRGGIESTSGSRLLPLSPETVTGDVRGKIHLQSADLFDYFSPLQRERQKMPPRLSDVFQTDALPSLVELDAGELEKAGELPQSVEEQLAGTHTHIINLPVLEVQHDENFTMERSPKTRKPLRIGLVLSGGPAPGGHNVVAGVYDFLKAGNPNSQLYGFKGGLDGFFNKEFVLVDDKKIDRFRNTGGFDMLWSGRGKVNEDDKPLISSVIDSLGLGGLIIVGGDGSNSNAAILAEYVASQNIRCSIIGIPKTIDGDLKNAAIECSFGFDTAAKTYSELIGNLCTDVCCGQGVYHFVRVMGRSASHLVFECAMQTRPNLVFIGEEIQALNKSLRDIALDITNLVLERARIGKNYGIILVPEGLIEFIPEMKVLIEEMSKVLTDGVDAREVIPSKLPQSSRELWGFLPDSIQDQLLGDRENTGYVQVAKIATERLLILLVEQELAKTEFNMQGWNRMHHYFGYEGRCAMPSNFDANYCYNLGFTAGTLIEHGRNGYMATVKHLDQEAPEIWRPRGVPFTKLMEMITLPNGQKIPGITRQLVDIESKLFKTFSQVRSQWRLGDYYRCPGPIQFEGPVADIANYNVTGINAEGLLSAGDQRVRGAGRALTPKRLGAYSMLQIERIRWTPPVPPVCQEPQSRLFQGSLYLPKDPYVRRQIMYFYPELVRNNQFYLQEVKSESTPALAVSMQTSPLRIGFCVLSRQSPGMQNIIWGIHERLSLTTNGAGRCLAFRGVEGLIKARNSDEDCYLEVTREDLHPFRNMGGIDLVGRSTSHELLKHQQQRAVLEACRRLKLDGLVLVGSSLGMTEASILSEYFLKKNYYDTVVVGVAATASNNVLHDLIETNIGFDTASKLYSSLIGNVLTDAASMPKYWHFVRLMGRQPSNEVLECALQTHPNVVIIAEEYGAGQKTLAQVAEDIAEVVLRRAEGTSEGGEPSDAGRCRNFGAVIIPDGLWHHLPPMRMLLKDLETLLQEAQVKNEMDKLRADLLAVTGETAVSPVAQDSYASRLSPWSTGTWQTLPKWIQKEFLTLNSELRDSYVETEVLLSQMVKEILAKWQIEGKYHGKFQCVCHYFGYQGRSAMPSNFDCSLAFTHGYLAAMCVESRLTGHLTNVRGLCGEVHQWKLSAVPFNCLFTLIPVQQDIQVHPDLSDSRRSAKDQDRPIIPNAEVNLQCKALRWMKVAKRYWEDQDRFCNPGPIQFWGNASKFYHRILHEEQADYFHMLTHVQEFAKILKNSCDFGVEEPFLKSAYVALNGLLTLRFHGDDVLQAMAPFPSLEELEKDLFHSYNHSNTKQQRRMRRALTQGVYTRLASGNQDSGSRTGYDANSFWKLDNVPEAEEDEIEEDNKDFSMRSAVSSPRRDSEKDKEADDE